MKHNKEHYKSLTYNGYQWYGYVSGKHLFQKGDYRTGYKTIRCTEEMLENGDIEFMAEHDLSFEAKFQKKAA